MVTKSSEVMMISTEQVISQFKEAMAARGIVPPCSIKADGRLHRCDAEGRGGRGDAAYLLHLDDLPAGGFQNWRDGLGWQSWCAKSSHTLSVEEQRSHQSRVEVTRVAREAREQERYGRAADQAEAIWAVSRPAVTHGYLTAKGIGANGLRIHDGRLVVPVRDSSGNLTSLQFIDDGGEKRFLSGGRVKGCFYLIGKVKDHLLVCEGFATGASLHEATNEAVAVAFNAGNLAPVAVALRGHYPKLPIIVCGDDDHSLPANVGRLHAERTAKLVNARVVFPSFGSDSPAEATDFNDLHRLNGLDAVRSCLEEAIADQATMKSETVSASKSLIEFGSFKGMKPRNAEWLWPNFIPKGALTLLFGRPGVGKTTSAMSIVSTLSNGGRWPVTGERAPQCSILLQEAEDDLNRTLSLLIANGANLERIVPMGMVRNGDDRRPFSLATDVPLLEEQLQKRPDIQLIVLSPINAFVGISDDIKTAQLRRALAPISDLMQRTGVAVLGIAHPRKGRDGDVLDSLAGSHVWIAAARSALLAIEDESAGESYFGPIKLNVAKERLVIPYRIDDAEVEGDAGTIVKTSRVRWGDQFAEESLRALYERAGQSLESTEETRSVAEWLSEFLSKGPVLAQDVLAAAKREGYDRISSSTFSKALKSLNGHRWREVNGFGSKWMWSLTPQESSFDASRNFDD